MVTPFCCYWIFHGQHYQPTPDKHADMDPNNNINRRFGDCYVFSKTIGNGNFSLVRKVRHKFSRSIYAAKIVKLPLDNNNDMIGGEDDYQDILDMMRGEVAVMRRLKHNNLLQFVDVFYTREQVILLTELAEVSMVLKSEMR